MHKPINSFKVQETEKVIRTEINPKKAPGCDLITEKIFQNLPDKAFRII